MPNEPGSPGLPPVDGRPLDERNLKESLGAIVPGTLITLVLGVLLVAVRQVFGFPVWLGVLLFAFAASGPLSDVVTIIVLRRALNKKP